MVPRETVGCLWTALAARCVDPKVGGYLLVQAQEPIQVLYNGSRATEDEDWLYVCTLCDKGWLRRDHVTTKEYSVKEYSVKDGSCEHIVEFESDDKKNGSPLVARDDLNNMAQTTNATKSEDMCEEVPWGRDDVDVGLLAMVGHAL